MAGASAPQRFLHVEVTCFICLNYYERPVTVECGHSFCQDCIEDRLGDDSEFTCPQCGEISDDVSHVSTQLSKLTEIIKQMTLQANKMGLCDLHGERLTLFCKEDQAIMCVLCKEAKCHKAHTVIPADQAAQECKVRLHKLQDILKRDRKNISQRENTWNQSISECQDQKKRKQELIHHCFKKVHQFLHEEENLLLRRLECESEATLGRLKKKRNSLSKNRSTVERRISEIEAMTQKQAPELLRDIKRIFTWRNNRIEVPTSVPSVLQLNYCFPGFLEMLQKYTEPVTLDPDTAYVDLIVLDDGKRIGYKKSKLFMLWKQPSSPGRCNFGPAVLGTGRFVDGRHYWEMEYEVYSDWEVGVCLDSVIRSHSVVTHADAECIYQKGLWTIWTAGIRYLGNPARARIGIFLDYEAGEVTFYSVTKRTVIKTFFDTFTGILRPYFEAHGNNQAGGLTMCPVIQWCAGPAIRYTFPESGAT